MKISIKTTKERTFKVSKKPSFMNYAMCYTHSCTFFGRPDLLIAYLEKYKPDLSLGSVYTIDTVSSILCSSMSNMPTPDRIRVLEYIISAYKLDLNTDTTKWGIPPLIYAMNFGDYDLLVWLFAHGVKIQSAMTAYKQSEAPDRYLSTHQLDLSKKAPKVIQLIKDTLYKEIMEQ